MYKIQLMFYCLLITQVTVVIVLAGREDFQVLKRPTDLGEITSKIIKSCYGDRVKEIGLAGKFSDSFIASMFSDDPIGVVLLHRDEGSARTDGVSEKPRYKLQIFAIAVTSLMELNKILGDIKESRWWNHMAEFYIFDSSGEEMGCSKAFDILWTAWTTDILYAKYICHRSTGENLIYGFNPYTELAPTPWKIRGTYRGVNDHPWTLLARKYFDNVDVCKNIRFDPSRNLGGYQVRATVYKGKIESDFTKTGIISSNPFVNKEMQAWTRSMNVSLKVAFHDSNESLGFVDEKGDGHGLLRDLTTGSSDILLWVVPLSSVSETPGLYPSYTELFAVTQHTAYVSQWEKVLSAIDRPSRIGLCITILINVIALKYILRQSFMRSILDTIRMICNSCFTKLPKNSSARFYLTCLFILVIVMQALFQGQLAALLAKQIRYPNVNDRRDLMESDHIIYGRHEDRSVFQDEGFEGRFVGINMSFDKCLNVLLRNSSIACIGFKNWAIIGASRLNLHVSSQPVARVPMFWSTRKNWPLEEKMNRWFQLRDQSSISDYHFKHSFAQEVHALDVYERGGSTETCKVLMVVDLNFAFIILAFGLTCAFVTFFIECLVERERLSRKMRKKRARRQFRLIYV